MSVTVMVALYKAGRFVEHKIKDLLRQTAINKCEVVLLNCQNIDNERSIYQPLIRDHHNFKEILYTEWCSLYKSWNDAIISSTTDYIMSSNADDSLKPDYIELLMTALNSHRDYDVAMGNSYVTGHINSSWPDWKYHGLIQTMFPLGTAGPCPMWRRSLYGRFGPFDERFCVISDALMWERWYDGGVKFLNVPEALSIYYQESGHNLETRLDEQGANRLIDLDQQQLALLRSFQG
jgi:hypothetical protein